MKSQKGFVENNSLGRSIIYEVQTCNLKTTPQENVSFFVLFLPLAFSSIMSISSGEIVPLHLFAVSTFEIQSIFIFLKKYFQTKVIEIPQVDRTENLLALGSLVKHLLNCDTYESSENYDQPEKAPLN